MLRKPAVFPTSCASHLSVPLFGRGSLDGLFECCVCMEDGPPKPDPFPVTRACTLLGVRPQDTIMVSQ